MLKRLSLVLAAAAAGLLLFASPAAAQQVEPCPAPVKQPPAGSPRLLRCIEFVFHPDGQTALDPMTYNYYMVRKGGSDSSLDSWIPYNEQEILDDFWRLIKTGFLDDLWIERISEPYDNGTPAEHIVYHMEERPRLKVIDYTGSKEVEISKIEENMKTAGISIRYDTFVDQAVLRKVKQLIKELYAEKGYNDAQVSIETAPMPGGPKLLHLTFDIEQGPKFKLVDVQFDGNKEVSDKTLLKQMKSNKPAGFLSFITGSGNFQEAKFEEDAELVTSYYQDHGYVKARIGSPQIERLRDSSDGKTREVRLSVPVDEGPRFKLGKLDITGNKAVKTEFLRPLFKVDDMGTGKKGSLFAFMAVPFKLAAKPVFWAISPFYTIETDEGYYSRKKLLKGYEKSKEVYGSGGYMEFTMVPDLSFRGEDPETGKPIGPDAPPNIVDVTLRMDEGKQYFVNRITFVGNTTTHDTVVRRDMRLLEGGVFNTEALKDSIRRINQLGYFKPIEAKGEAVAVEKSTTIDGKVDINLKVEEQNRNQLAFGAGISQFEGFFGQFSFQTANFLGRGETVGVQAQKGVQASNYQASFSEPYLFDRPISAGIDVYKREYIFPLAYTQASTGSNFSIGMPVRNYTRAFFTYAYEQVQVKDINPTLQSAQVLNSSPYLIDALLLNQSGRRKVSKITPSLVYNTVNQPIFPTAGTRYSATMSLAGSILGGNTDYVSTNMEGIWYFPLSARTTLGLHAQAQYVRPYGRTTTLPIFEKFFMGGEYSVRGFDIRTIGPRDPSSGIVTGGNKTLLFNAEYYINVGGPVRLIGFYDAGQVQDLGQRFKLNEDLIQYSIPTPAVPYVADPFYNIAYSLVNPLLTQPVTPTQTVIGRTSAFKTSTGLEVRFFMPVLNVPFRVIAAYNPARFGILDNNLRPAEKFTFRFAVGTTF